MGVIGAGFLGDGSSIFIKSSQHCFHWPAQWRQTSASTSPAADREHRALHAVLLGEIHVKRPYGLSANHTQGPTHVIEMLPKGLHPAMRLLAAVCGHGVCDLLPSVLVADADILSFTQWVLL